MHAAFSEIRRKPEFRKLEFVIRASDFFRISSFVICHSLVFAIVASSYGAEEGFTPLFDGKTLQGWHVSSKTGHSRASKNMSGGKWVVENGAIVGSQDIPGNGGIVITDEQFGDFEVALEMNNDFGPDSGLFLRSTEDGKAWQDDRLSQGRQRDGSLR